VGGSAKGFEKYTDSIVGIDISPQSYYPYEFVQSDVFDLPMEFFEDFDFIWSSPPCQAYCYGTKWKRNEGKEYPDLADKTRQLLKNTGKPFVMENVPGSPLRKDLILCGDMWDMKIIRHRIFEIEGFHVPQLKHRKHKGFVGSGEKIGVFNASKQRKRFIKNNPKYTIAGHQDGTLKQWQDAMEINWVKDKSHLSQCVPPRYSEYIISNFPNGRQKEISSLVF